jgi:hypothetical protein
MNRPPQHVTFIAFLLLAASISITMFVGNDALQVQRASDHELLAQMRGAAYEDIFGLGYWPNVVALICVQSLMAAAGWFLLRQSRWRVVAIGCLLAFMLAAALQYSANQREVHLWSSIQSYETH